MPEKDKGYWICDYYGKNIIGNPCHTYELKDNTGKTVYRMNNELLPDGTEMKSPIEVFYKKAEAIMGKSEGKHRA